MSSNQQSGETKDLAAGETDRPTGYRRNGIPATSIGGFVVAAAALLVATPLGTWVLVRWFPALAPAEALIESALNIGVVLPLLLFLFVLPGARNLRQRQAAEGALRAERQDLALRVHERTAELEESNRRLREEVEVRQAAQGAVRESEEQYSILVESLPTGVFIFRNDRLLFVNPKLAEMLE
ncbi:MAG: PAS domain-containing protein, partial [Chromatiaceae bacterium]